MSPEELAAQAEYRAHIVASLETMTAVAVLGVSLIVFLLAVMTVRQL